MKGSYLDIPQRPGLEITLYMDLAIRIYLIF